MPRIQQPFDYPDLEVDVDRTKAQQGGLTERDVATSVLNTLSGSFQITPMFFLNWKNGVNYNLLPRRRSMTCSHCRTCRTFRSRRRGTRSRRSWQMSPRSSGPGDGGVSPLQHSPRVDIYAQCAGTRSRRRRARIDRIVDPTAIRCRAAASCRSVGRSRPCGHSYIGPVRRARLLDPARLSADRGQFSVLAGSVHHHLPRCRQHWPASCCSCSSPEPR